MTAVVYTTAIYDKNVPVLSLFVYIYGADIREKSIPGDTLDGFIILSRVLYGPSHRRATPADQTDERGLNGARTL